MSRWEIEYHTTLMTLIRLTRNLRAADCEHCAVLMTQIYVCMSEETNEIRRRSNEANRSNDA